MSVRIAVGSPRAAAKGPRALAKPLSRVDWLLHRLGYDPCDVAAVVEHCRRHGTAVGCGLVDECDRGPIEDLLGRPAI